MYSPPEQEKIDAYLDRMCEPLRFISREVREEARRETTLHLDALITELEMQGHEPAEAVDAALAQFGDPVKIGKKIGLVWIKDPLYLLSPETKRREYVYSFLRILSGVSFGLIGICQFYLGSWYSWIAPEVALGLFAGILSGIDLQNMKDGREARKPEVSDSQARLAERRLELMSEKRSIRRQLALWFIPCILPRCLMLDEEPANPLMKLNIRFLMGRVMRLTIILLLQLLGPLGLRFQGLALLWWILWTMNPIGEIVAWKLNQRLQTTK